MIESDVWAGGGGGGLILIGIFSEYFQGKKNSSIQMSSDSG